MSFFDSASLVQIPSGYSDGTLYSVKPIDGSGDLTFSRGSDIEATRVNANGYIEKAKVNLLLQSNTFDTTWTQNGTSITGGQSDKDGGTDAWLLEAIAGSGSQRQSISTDGVVSYSLYAKAGNVDWVRLRIDASTDTNAWFDLGTGSVGTNEGIDATITSVGGGWYRIILVVNNTSINTVRIYPTNADLVGGSIGDNIYIQDAQLNYGLVAQEYQETTTTSVITGITNDMPRLDYSGGASCPSLLLEPSRQNLFTHDTYLNGLTFIQATATQNTDISPEGVQNAARLYDNAVNGQHRIGESISVTNGTAYTWSVFVKKGTLRYCYLLSTANGTARYFFDLQEGTAITSGGKIEDYGSGWYRISAQITSNTTSNEVFALNLTDSSSNNTYAGTGTDYHIVYGFQCEAGNFVSSLIPTYGTSDSRPPDTFNINPSSLVGATQGSWFFELDDLSFAVTGTSVPTNWIGYNVSNCLGIEGRAVGETKNIYFVKEESNVVTTLTAKEISTTLKACFVWNGTSLKCFVDGVKAYDAGGFTQPLAWSTFEFNSSGREAQQTLKQTLLFPTAISDADAIALTA